MPIQTERLRNALVDTYRTRATHGVVFSTVPGATPGTLIGAGMAVTWNAAAGSTASSEPIVFNIPAGTTVAGFGLYEGNPGSGGVYVDGMSVTSQPFSSAGTYSVTASFTQN